MPGVPNVLNNWQWFLCSSDEVDFSSVTFFFFNKPLDKTIAIRIYAKKFTLTLDVS